MAREKNPKIEEAFKLYKKGHKLVDIANELEVPAGTVRRWKSTYKWDGERSLNKNERSVNKENVQNKKSLNKKNKEIIKEPIADEVKEVMENDELNDNQRLFCVIYAKRHNATKAYQRVYNCTYETAMVEGCKALRNPKIKEQLNRLLEAELNKEFLKKGLIQQYKDIAFADIGDYVQFGKKYKRVWGKDKNGKDVPIIDPETREQKIKEYSYIDLKESSMVDTSLITEISEGKDGIKFKLADKMKAMDILSKLSNLLSDEEKTKLDIEYKKLQALKLQADIEKTKAEINKITGNDLEIEDTEELENDIYGSDN